MNSNFTRISSVAIANGYGKMAEKYENLLSLIESTSLKRYAILGEANSGKSTIINSITGEKSVPVSVIIGKHDKILTVPCKDKDYELVEISIEQYTGKETDISKNPLWSIDAAVYIISALNPLSASDIEALNACISKGIPCTLVLNKLDMVDESDKELTIKTLKTQLYTTFGSEEIIIFDVKNPGAAVEKILEGLNNSENTREIREYGVTAEFAKELNTCLSAEYDRAKQAYDSLKKTESDSRFEKLFWEEIEMEIEKRKIHLISETDNVIYKMYGNCNSVLNKKMNESPDVLSWWKTRLRREMERESAKISRQLEADIEEHTSTDKRWLSENINDKFGIKLKMKDIDPTSNPYRSSPADINQQFTFPADLSQPFTDIKANKKMALGSLLTSAAVLAGGILLPLSTIPTIITCGIGGVAVIGTGLWTYLETTGEKGERVQILKGELNKYVAQCRDTTLESIHNYIKCFYDNMVISAKEAQVIKMSQEITPSEEESRALERLRKIGSEKKKAEDILRQIIITEDDDDEN